MLWVYGCTGVCTRPLHTANSAHSINNHHHNQYIDRARLLHHAAADGGEPAGATGRAPGGRHRPQGDWGVGLCVWKGGLSVVGRWLVHTVYIRPTDTPSIPINNCPNPTRRQNAIKQNWELGDEARAKGQQPPPEAVREEEKVRLFMCMWCVTSGGLFDRSIGRIDLCIAPPSYPPTYQ